MADKHKWSFVRTGFNKVVAPRPKQMAYIVVFSELAIGLGLAFGFLTPIAAVGGLLLNLMYFVMMIDDWAEQGQNLMMALIEVVILGTHAWQHWSLDNAIGLFVWTALPNQMPPAGGGGAHLERIVDGRRVDRGAVLGLDDPFVRVAEVDDAE